MISTAALDSYLKSRLHSRMIPFETYTFADGNAVIIVSLRSSRFSVSIPYMIHYIDEKVYRLVTPLTFYDEPSLSSAISKLTLDMRKLEVKFHKWKK